MTRRRAVVKAACDAHWGYNLGPGLNTWAVFKDPNQTMMYCHVAKAGCTFWARVFSFITRPEDMKRLNITSPFDVMRITAHSELAPEGHGDWSLLKQEVHADTSKFFFARDPYARLWSVYLDKYYLPGSWNSYEFSSSVCLLNISFSDFLAFAMTSKDGHVRPVSETCNPCVFQPIYIGKVETFSSDSMYILSQFNLSHLLDGFDFANYTQTEMRSILYDYYQLYSDLNLTQCLSIKDLARRMWKVFQINGHIRESSEFPENLEEYSRDVVMTRLTDLVHTKPMSRTESNKQRRKYLCQAYKSVSGPLIKAIQERFRADFEMFEYSETPPQ
ncbi:carbohydrate sulfotransferase 9-like [Physella acuta]|uniref:carbohydrate sulfotransferase 9-like n=1 Tax=Physella acuta TaxID=109671 RepID=UPI0027DDB75F|nr:carbohydrate sulfotransferase 9-like [Physella acuta]